MHVRYDPRVYIKITLTLTFEQGGGGLIKLCYYVPCLPKNFILSGPDCLGLTKE